MQWLIYMVMGLAVPLLLGRLLAIFQSRRSVGRPVPDTAAVDEGAGTPGRRLYYFFAPHCGPCKAMTPLVDRLRGSHLNLIKVNVAESASLARKFGVVGTPSFVLVEDGTICKIRLGGQSEQQLLNMLQGGWHECL